MPDMGRTIAKGRRRDKRGHVSCEGALMSPREVDQRRPSHCCRRGGGRIRAQLLTRRTTPAFQIAQLSECLSSAIIPCHCLTCRGVRITS